MHKRISLQTAVSEGRALLAAPPAGADLYDALYELADRLTTRGYSDLHDAAMADCEEWDAEDFFIEELCGMAALRKARKA